MSADQITDARIAKLEGAYLRGCRTDAVGAELFDIIRSLRAEVQRLTDEARRSDAGRVEVPEISLEDGEAILRSFPASLPAWEDGNWSLAFNKVADFLRVRLSPSPQPATGAAPDVSIIRTQGYTTIWWTSTPNQPRSAEALERHLRDNPRAVREDLWRHPPQPSADVVVVPREELTELLSLEAKARVMLNYKNWSADRACAEMSMHEPIEKLDALRSSTNHDSKDTP